MYCGKMLKSRYQQYAILTAMKTFAQKQRIAVKAMIINDDGEMLVLRQSAANYTGHNKYHPPGGIVELGETLEAALNREVTEETGMKLRDFEMFDVTEWNVVGDDQHMQFFGVFYICHAMDYDITLQLEEVDKVKWINASSMNKIDIIEPSRTIIRKYYSLKQ